MELEVAVTLSILGIALGLIGYKSISRYLHLESQKVTSDQKSNYENHVLDLQNKLQTMENSRDGYKQKLYAVRRDYDVDFEDDEINTELDTNSIIPEIAAAIFPKMPKKLKELLGKEELQTALFKVAEKNADKIPDWINKFIVEKEPANSTTMLKERYL